MQYYRNYGKKRRMGKILFVLLVLGIASFAFTYYRLTDTGDINQPPLQTEEKKPQTPQIQHHTPVIDQPSSPEQNETVIDTETKVIYETHYTLCGHKVTDPMDQKLVGLNQDSVKEVFSGWDVSFVDAQKVVLSQSQAELCPECTKYLFIGVKDNYIAIYHGVPGRGTVVKKQTEIPISALPTELQEKMKTGVPIESVEEGLMMLEGIEY